MSTLVSPANHSTNWSGFSINLELALRIYLFLTMSIYGWGKLAGDQFFIRGNVPPEIASKTLAEATAHDIAWVFFGYSAAYLWFIGISQGLTAIMLLLEKTKILGIAAMIPIMLNVIVVDICYGVSPGPLMSAILYFVWTGILIYLNRERIGALLALAMGQNSPPAVPEFRPRPARKPWLILGIMAGMAILELSLFLLLHFNVRKTKDFWFFKEAINAVLIF